MHALRQIHSIKDHTVTIKLPHDFPADQVEVIILPVPVKHSSEDDLFDAAANSLYLSVDISQMNEAQRHAYKRTQTLLEQGRLANAPRILGLFAGLVQMSEEFDAPLPDETLYWGTETDEYGVSLVK